jgi:hypothetical protein
MRSPFPGMDPHLESPTHWSDFHPTFIQMIRAALNGVLPQNYVARIDEIVSLIPPVSEIPDESVHVPDVLVLQRSGASPTPPRAAGAGAAVLEPPKPVTLEAVTFLDERTEVVIKIVRLPELELVTVIELLSPTNKYGGGRAEYLQKRREFLRLPVNLVEFDLIRAGPRLPFRTPFPSGHYFGLVTRATDVERTQAYGWTVRDPWPAIPIPLREPDADVAIDLALAFAQAFEMGRYGELIDYTKPAPRPAFAPADAEWVAEIARAGAKSS